MSNLLAFCIATSGISMSYAQTGHVTGTDNTTAQAQPNSLLDVQKSDIQKAIDKAKQKNLANHPTWLRLNYYQSKNQSGKLAYSSKVENPNFFISPEGKKNPQSELEATITALLSHTTSTTTTKVAKNNSIGCQFPARTHWLTLQLGLESTVAAGCSEFDAWMQRLDPKRLSVIFVEEYVDNPLSAFGHTLMLIDSSASLANPKALDKAHALNSTVGGDADAPLLIYSYKSMVGAYPNEVTIEPLPTKLAYYLQQDKRDVWVYPLNLTNAEVQQIMRHVWETKDIKVPYYFTKDNCASEILRYIDIVRSEGSLVDKLSLAVVPSDVIRLLKSEGLIAEQKYIPANDTLAQATLNERGIGSFPISSISTNDTLVPTDLVPVANNPLNAHSIQRGMVGVGQQDDTGYVSLAYRAGFNGLLDRPNGYPQNFDLEGMSLELRVYDKEEGAGGSKHSQVEIENLTLIRGRSFNPLNTAKKGDSTLSTWGIKAQMAQVKDGSQTRSSSHLVGSLAYEKGVSFAFGIPKKNSGQLPPQLCYALGTGVAQVGNGLSNNYRVGVGANLGCRYQFGTQFRLVGEAQFPYWYHGDASLTGIENNYWQPSVTLGAQYDLDKNKAIRLQGKYQFQERVEHKDEVQLQYVNYF